MLLSLLRHLQRYALTPLLDRAIYDIPTRIARNNNGLLCVTNAATRALFVFIILTDAKRILRTMVYRDGPKCYKGTHAGDATKRDFR